MRQIISIFILSTALSSCGNSQHNNAVEQAKNIQSAIKPGSMATTTYGYTMTAKINGKTWVASSMIPPNIASRIIGYYNNEYIGLPYSKSDMIVGKKITINEDEAADFFINNGCLWKNPKGEVEITKVDNNKVEGKFYFTTTCSNTNEAVKITDGVFRILLSIN